MSYSRVPSTLAAPGTDSNTYVLFSTYVASPGGSMHQGAGIKKLMVTIKNSQAGTLNTYRGGARSTLNVPTFTQLTAEAIAAGTSTTSTSREYLIEPFGDWKLEWVNGGVAQATWTLDMALSDEQGSST